MNSLILNFCVLIEALLIISSSTKKLPIKSGNLLASPITPLMGPTDPSDFPLTGYGSGSAIQDQPVPSSKPLCSYNYNTDTGIQIQKNGYLNYIGIDKEALEAPRSYSYIDNEGNFFFVLYTANENGFQPKGAYLPTIPPLIIKTLQYIAEHPEENGE